MCDHVKFTCEYIQVVGMNLAPVKTEGCSIFLQGNSSMFYIPSIKIPFSINGPYKES